MDVVDEERQVRYPSLASTLVSARLRRQSMAEELRVLYVAVTRAKEHLIGVGTCKETAEEEWTARWSGHVGPIPADDVSFVLRKIMSRIVCANSAGASGCAVTSR